MEVCSDITGFGPTDAEGAHNALFNLQRDVKLAPESPLRKLQDNGYEPPTLAPESPKWSEEELAAARDAEFLGIAKIGFIPERIGEAPQVSAGSKDPWAHRSDNMRCKTCMWFALKGTGNVGRCRRHAPTISGYPVVFVSDWCGDHKLDETKV